MFVSRWGQKEVITQFSQNHLEVLNVHSMCYIALNIYFEFAIEEGEQKWTASLKKKEEKSVNNKWQ